MFIRKIRAKNIDEIDGWTSKPLKNYGRVEVNYLPRTSPFGVECWFLSITSYKGITRRGRQKQAEIIDITIKDMILKIEKKTWLVIPLLILDQHFSTFSYYRTGVSNTCPAGRMWPAKSVYAAHVEIKFLKSIKIYGKVGTFKLEMAKN